MKKPLIMISFFVMLLTLVYLKNMKGKIKKAPKKEWKMPDNYPRHLYANEEFNHYSIIKKEDLQKYPKLRFCSKFEVTLHKGDILYLPKKWWCWMEFYHRSILVSFYDQLMSLKLNQSLFQPLPPSTMGSNYSRVRMMELISADAEKIGGDAFYLDSPLVIRQGYSLDKWTDDYLLSKVTEVDIWDTTRESVEKGTFKQFVELKETNKYIFTLDHFVNNSHLRDSLREDVIVPAVLGLSQPNFHLLFSYNYLDTGLHRHDVDHLFCLVDGMVRVRLYSPYDTPYLKELSLMPRWTNLVFPFHLSPNLYRVVGNIENLNDSSYPSSILLFRTVPNKILMSLIDEIHRLYQSHNVVYHISNVRGVLSWEFCFYRIRQLSEGLIIENKNNPDSWIRQLGKFLHFNVSTIITNRNQLVMSSFHYHPGNLTSEVDLYYYLYQEPHVYFPLFLAILNGNRHKGTQIIDFRDSLIQNLDKYLGFLKVSTNCDWISREVNRFDRKDDSNNERTLLTSICALTVKNEYHDDDHGKIKIDHKIALTWFHLDIQFFMEFLKEFQWQGSFIDWIVEKEAFFRYLHFEVSLEYDLSGQVVGSSFYGFL